MKKKQNIFIKENFSSLLEIFVETKKIALFILLLIGSDVKSEWIQKDFLLLLNKKKPSKITKGSESERFSHIHTPSLHISIYHELRDLCLLTGYRFRLLLHTKSIERIFILLFSHDSHRIYNLQQSILNVFKDLFLSFFTMGNCITLRKS